MRACMPSRKPLSCSCRSTTAAKAFIAEARGNDRTPLKSDEIDQIEAMRVVAHARLKEYDIVLDPARSELAALDEIDDVWCRAMFDNVPVVQDNSCPAGEMFFLSTSEVAVRVMPVAVPEEYDFETGTLAVSGDPEYQFGDGQTEINCKLNELAMTGDAYNMQLITYLQLEVTRPNSCGILGDLS